jgi:CBS domain-containing protein
MCCCGCAMAVLEPGAGFGSWRALFGFGGTQNRRSSMKARDVMTEHVITVAPDASIVEALQLMLQNRISGLPVVDRGSNLVGIVTEGDFLRRSETGTERRRPRWVEFILGPGTIAKDYVHSHARRIDEVMTANVETVGEDAGLEDVVALMEKRRVKRVPVMRGTKLVGIISRANLLHALATLAGEVKPGAKSDETLRTAVIAELDRQSWAPRHMIDVVVRNGVVELWGTVIDPDQRDAARVVAETVPGVKAVKCHIVWVEPMSGMAFSDPSEEASEPDRKSSSAPPTAHVAIV